MYRRDWVDGEYRRSDVPRNSRFFQGSESRELTAPVPIDTHVDDGPKFQYSRCCKQVRKDSPVPAKPVPAALPDDVHKSFLVLRAVREDVEDDVREVVSGKAPHRTECWFGKNGEDPLPVVVDWHEQDGRVVEGSPCRDCRAGIAVGGYFKSDIVLVARMARLLARTISRKPGNRGIPDVPLRTPDIPHSVRERCGAYAKTEVIEDDCEGSSHRRVIIICLYSTVDERDQYERDSCGVRGLRRQARREAYGILSRA